ncbi:MAG: 30S ribosomal protein THX [Myxococcales bacterium]|nr:30S ribosomal protein THX [Myxococcales bacterium]
MGKGDRKTAKGKRFRHSFGKSRPKSKLRKRKRAEKLSKKIIRDKNA